MYKPLITISIFSITLKKVTICPEFFLAFTSLLLLVVHFCLVLRSKQYKNILLQFSFKSLCTLILFLTLILYCNEKSIWMKHLSFEFAFLNDSLGFFSKIVTIFTSLVCMYFIQDYGVNRTEKNLLLLYSIFGLSMLVAENDFGTIFLALELQSLSLFILFGYKNNSIYTIENGLKYFILGALSAAYFLLGWSLLYGISGLFVLLSFHFFFFNAFFSKVSQFKESAIECLTFDENKSSSDTDLSESFLIELKHLLFFIGDADDAIAISVGNPNFKNVKVKVVRLFCPDDNGDLCVKARKILFEESEDIMKTTVTEGEKGENESNDNRDPCEEVRKIIENSPWFYAYIDSWIKIIKDLLDVEDRPLSRELCLKAIKRLEDFKLYQRDVLEGARHLLDEACILYDTDLCEEILKSIYEADFYWSVTYREVMKMLEESDDVKEENEADEQHRLYLKGNKNDTGS